jgi:mono/diheme cytochrome c family protein
VVIRSAIRNALLVGAGIVVGVILTFTVRASARGEKPTSALFGGGQPPYVEHHRIATADEILKGSNPTKTLAVFDPHERRKISFEGLSLKETLDRDFGSAWKSAEVILFHCADGYKSPVPTAKIVAENSLLATRRLDRDSFTVDNHGQNEKSVPLAPFYLVWDNLDGPYETEDGAFWPYQVVAIELTSFAEKFPHIVPSVSASNEVKDGFRLFQQHCLSCHKINGEGGDKGGELNTPVSAFERHPRERLQAWIDNPAKVLNGSGGAGGPTMPPLNTRLERRAESIDALIAYLEDMSKRKFSK